MARVPKVTSAHNSWLLALVLVIVTFVAYRPVWRAGFIWDDDDHLTSNPAMLSVDGLKQIWSSLAVSRYYPLTLTTFWIERRLWGLAPLPYHAVNVALQAANGVLLWMLLRRLGVPGAWLAAAVWVIHPVCVESVAWVTELKNVQSGFFLFLAVLCFLKFESDNSRRAYTFAMAFGAAAMLSKPSTVVLPILLLLCAWWRDGRCRRSELFRAAPFFGLAAAMSALTVIEQQREVWVVNTESWQLSPAERLTIAGKAVWFYAAHVLWPAKLTFIYPRWDVSAGSASAWLSLAGTVVASALLWTYRRRPWARAALFGTGVFLTALLPVLGFFDIYYFRYSFVADHFQYLACIGLIALVVGTGTVACARAGRWGRELGAIGAGMALLILGASTWRQARIYQDLETLWQDTVAKNPECFLAHNNLGVAFANLGKVAEAKAQWQQALQIEPDYVEAHGNLGNVLYREGRIKEAVAHYEHVLRINPDLPGAHYDLGLAWARLGRREAAIGQYKQALRLKPDYAEAYGSLANSLAQAGRLPEAMRLWEQALRFKPDYPEVQNDLAWLLATLAPKDGGDPARAVTLAKRACELTNNRTAEYLDTLGAAYAAAGRFDDAIAATQKAIGLARSEGQMQLADEIETRLELYRAGHAYRAPASGTSRRGQ